MQEVPQPKLASPKFELKYLNEERPGQWVVHPEDAKNSFPLFAIAYKLHSVSVQCQLNFYEEKELIEKNDKNNKYEIFLMLNIYFSYISNEFF